MNDFILLTAIIIMQDRGIQQYEPLMRPYTTRVEETIRARVPKELQEELTVPITLLTAVVNRQIVFRWSF